MLVPSLHNTQQQFNNDNSTHENDLLAIMSDGWPSHCQDHYLTVTVHYTSQGQCKTGGPPHRGQCTTGGPPHRGQCTTGGPPHRGQCKTGGPPHRGQCKTGGPPHRGQCTNRKLVEVVAVEISDILEEF
jgi:hypothetical protein